MTERHKSKSPDVRLLNLKFMITRNFYVSANYGITVKESSDGEAGDTDYKVRDFVLKLEMQL